jgi:hypothetical protein
MSKYQFITIYFFILILSSTSSAIEIVTYGEAAERYFQSDIIIVGDLIKKETKELKNDDELYQFYQHKYEPDISIYDIYEVRIDSVMKGSYKDSTITLLSQPYLHAFGGSADRIRRSGKYIIFIKVVMHCYVSELAAPYLNEKILFLKEISTADSLTIKKVKNNRKNFSM